MAHHYEIIIVPEHGENPRHFLLSGFMYGVIRIILLLTVLSVILGAVTSSFILHRVIGYHDLVRENDSLKQITMQVDQIKDNYSHIIGDINYLRMISGLPYSDSLPQREDQNTKEYLDNKDTVGVGSISTIPSILPVSGVVSQTFVNEGNTEHHGVDFSAPVGSRIKVTADGVVDTVFDDTYLGKVIRVDHKNGYISEYAHCSAILVKEGQSVTRGTIIAKVGNSGNSSGPHLHYAIIHKNVYIDPSQFY